MPAILTAIALYFWELLKIWGSLFAAPFTNLEMLWIIIPTYLNWIFADLFQEKKGTSLGNAISNAIIILWVSIDWSRSSIRFFSDKIISSWHLTWNIVASVIAFLYGIWVLSEGIKGRSITHHIGRIRIITYIILMVTPLIYTSNIPLTKAIIAMAVFFFPYYYIIELIDHLLPDPASIREEGEKSGGVNADAGFDSSFSNNISNPNTGNDFGSLKNQKNNQNRNFNDFRNFKL